MDTQRLVHNNPHLISNLQPLNENAKWRTSLLVHCRRVGVYHRRRTSHRHRHRHLSSLWVVVGGWCRRRPAVVSSVNVENGGKINLAVAVIIILWRECHVEILHDSTPSNCFPPFLSSDRRTDAPFKETACKRDKTTMTNDNDHHAARAR
jgi:hypothetical protein